MTRVTRNLFWTSYVVLWLIVVILLLLLLLVYRQFGLMIMPGSQRISYGGLDKGSRAPAITIRLEGGPEIAYDWSNTLRCQRSHIATVALFGLPGCPICDTLARDAATGQLVNDYPSIAFVWISGQLDSPHPAPAHWLKATSHHGSAHSVMDIPGTPFAYVVSVDSLILSKGLVNSARDIGLLITSADIADFARPTGQVNGDAAPTSPRRTMEDS